MLVKQVSAFIENKAGCLAEIADILAENHIDISALSLADTADYGIARMILGEPDKAVEVLRQAGVVCKVTDVIAVAADDVPGGFAKSLHWLTDSGVEIKYMYACVSSHDGKALMIFSVENAAEAEKIIASTDAGKVNPSDIYRI